jgi:hypothetical protein
MTHDWIETSVALLAVGGCAFEARNSKAGYDRARRSTYMDEPPHQPAVSAMTQPLATLHESACGEWSIDTFDAAGNPMHACSRAADCTHIPAKEGR